MDLQALKKLGPTTVYLIGGEDRYETSIMLAEEVQMQLSQL